MSRKQSALVHLSTSGYAYEKYKRYTHGNRLGDRRIVLDNQPLSGIAAAENIRLIQPELLLERVLATL